MPRLLMAWAALLLLLPGPGLADDSVFVPVLTLQTDGRGVRATWTQLPSVSSYHLAWAKEGGGSVGSSGAQAGSAYSLVPGQGGRYCFQAFAVQVIDTSVSVIPSNRECVDLPEGGLIGRGKVTVKGTFSQVAAGTDQQNWSGSAEFNIYASSPMQDLSVRARATREDPPIVFHYALWGQGKITWNEQFNGPNCVFMANSTGRLTVSGQLRTAPDCQLDLVCTENYPTSCPMGSCQGYPLDCINLTPVAVKLSNVDLVEGIEVVVPFEGGGGTTTYTFSNMETDLSTGCVVGSQVGGSTSSGPVRVADFTPGEGDTIKDNSTGLTWLASDGGQDLDWVESWFRCSLAGMRLPTQDELAALYDPGLTNPTPPGEGCSGGYHLPQGFSLACGRVWASDQREGKMGVYDFGAGGRQYFDLALFQGTRCLCVSP